MIRPATISAAKLPRRFRCTTLSNSASEYLRIGFRTLIAGVQTSPSSLPCFFDDAGEPGLDLGLVDEVHRGRLG